MYATALIDRNKRMQKLLRQLHSLIRNSHKALKKDYDGFAWVEDLKLAEKDCETLKERLGQMLDAVKYDLAEENKMVQEWKKEK